ncbi:hypothetical protein GMDG_00484 [Pseudogymnoascus destructans 20631-21]|uniref:Uncharacterized protein n=1 Tax=Pseudogymnoascus destructans (strain ATCC MYA-4855 / 20631-21) TaxID=658429 RepID=L8G571_PSED2|nr:hypothetical protein GMDG_00484 [Pseudogymnoascus destructans 20631-21]
MLPCCTSTSTCLFDTYVSSIPSFLQLQPAWSKDLADYLSSNPSSLHQLSPTSSKQIVPSKASGPPELLQATPLGRPSKLGVDLDTAAAEKCPQSIPLSNIQQTPPG